MKIERVEYESPNYPELLKTISNPPECLYCAGDLQLLSRPCVAIVGSRRATDYGMDTARQIARHLGNSGITVVSGFAKGIDMAAHEGSIDTPGSTIAVLGSAIDMEMSRQKEKMFHRIMEKGLVISEYPKGTPPSRYTFPQRNRIISGLSMGTIVTEAAFSSGSLITAETAAEQGRTVYALPGNISSPQSLGTNKLIKDGAVPVTSMSDLSDYFGICHNEPMNMGLDERRFYDYLKEHHGAGLNQLCSELYCTKAYACGILSVMEIKGIVTTSEGRVWPV